MKRVMTLYGLYQFFFTLLLWFPVFYEYQKRMGLDDLQIFSIQSFYYFIFCVLEIPTGAAADRFGYKKSLIWSSWILIVANIIPVVWTSYLGFLFHFFFIALARSFNSGASSAYLYEYLSTNGSVEDYKNVEGKIRAWGLLGKVGAWAMMGPLMEWKLSLPYVLTTIAACLSLIFASQLKELKIKEKISTSYDFLAIPSILKKKPVLVVFMLQGIGVFVLARILQVNLMQPILGEKSFNLIHYGWILSVMTLFEAIGSFYPGIFSRKFKNSTSVYFFTAAMAMTLYFFKPSGQFWVIFLFCVFSLVTGFVIPIQRQLMNDVIPDSMYRATLLSLESLLDRAVCAWVAFSLGAYLQAGKLFSFLNIAASVTLILLVTLFVIQKMFFQKAVS